MNDIINEIKNDISEERYIKIFTQHGKKLIIAGVLAMVLTAAMTIYKNISNKKSRESGTLFMEAFDGSDPAKYDAVITSGQKAYAPMASLIKSSLQSSNDKYDDAIKTLDVVIADQSYDTAFREKALLDKAYILIEKKADKAEILKIIDSVSTERSVFRATALELKASYLLQSGDKKAAMEIFTQLAADNQIPSTMQDRAKHIIATINE